MCAKLQRLLEKRRGENIVHDQLCARFVGNLCNGGNVDDFECRVRRAFKKHDLGIGAHGRFPVGHIRAVDDRDFHAIARQDGFDDITTRAEDGAGRDDMIARLYLAENGGGNGGHAGGGGAGVFRAFQRTCALFKHVGGRVGVARIDETRIFTLETRFGSFRRGVKEALRQKQGFRHFGETGAQRSGMDEFGCRAKFAGILSRHFSNLSKAGRPGQEESLGGQ